MKAFLVVLLSSAYCVASLAAQPLSPNYVFGRYQQVNWQERDGLPQNTVLAITVARDGYLWVGTYEGAARFDGVRFTLFNASNTSGIGNSLINAILETRDGSLWLATYGGGLSRFRDDQFTQYSTRDGLSNDFTSVLFEDADGTLWIGTDGGGVNALRDGRFTPYTTAGGLPSDLVRAVVPDGAGGLLVGTNRGIARIAGGRVSAYQSRPEIVHADVRTLARAADGSLWVATMSGALYRDAEGVVTTFGPADGLTNDVVELLFLDQDAVMWVGTTGSGLFRYADGRFARYAVGDGLPGGRVASIAQAADHGLWVGTDRGLVRLKPPRFTIYTQRDGLPSDYIGSMLSDADGAAWIASAGVSRFSDGHFTVLTAKDGLPDNRNLRLARGADGHPLVSTRSGLVRWRPTEGADAKAGRLVGEPVAGVPWEFVQSLLEDRSGRLWIAILDGGLIRVSDGQVTRLTKKDGLADNSVLSLFEDRAGSLWVGTLRNGMTRISNGQMTSWSTRDGLAADHVKTFLEDADGALWIGTHGGGLSRFKDGRFATVSARQGLYNDDIFQILEDDDGNLWMNCNTGIWRTSLQQLNDVADGRRASVESFAYGTADGMLSAEGVGGTLAGAKMRDGSLWFPTTDGIVVVDPRRRDTEPPRVLIERVTIDRQPTAVIGPVHLTPGQENLEIEYTGLSWSRPQAVRFRYRLRGLDRDWVDAGGRRTAYYSHLPPGSYTFSVTADNGEGVWNETGQTLAVVVLPPFYRTWWFQALGLSSLIALVWLSVRYRVGQMRRAQAAQQMFSRQLIESQERERQRIAAELHDSLGQSLLVVKNRAMLGELSQPNEHALKQFNEIGATVAHALEEVRAISYNLRPHHLDQLGLTTTIGVMIDRMAESSGIRMSHQLDDIDGVFAAGDEITIYRIIQESLNNIVKHAKASEAQVTVRCHEHHVDIAVRDDGQGFAVDASPADTTTHGGFGLKGLAHRVDMLGATHIIESAPGRGTTVTVRIDRRDEAGRGD